MSTPKPGEIRCPTCHRSTPPAAFCTQCGSPIPSGARARPRGMDRNELQERIRARRLGEDEPYRRGVSGAGGYPGGFQPFQPEPEDVARHDAPEAPPPRVDNYAGEYQAPAAPEPPPVHYTEPPSPYAPPPAYIPPGDAPAPRPDTAWEEPGDQPPLRPVAPAAPVPPPIAPVAAAPPYPDVAYEDVAYEPDEYPYEYEEERGGRGGILAVLGFVALGLLALAAGAVLAGVFTADDGVATPTLTAPAIGASPPPVVATPEPTAQPTAPSTPAEGATPTPGPDDLPVTFRDGFVAEVQPCATSDMDFDGCQTDASRVNDDEIFVWIGFEEASSDDMLSVRLESNGARVSEAEFDLGGPPWSCPPGCMGYARQSFTGLTPGDYEVILERNGSLADRKTFSVEG